MMKGYFNGTSTLDIPCSIWNLQLGLFVKIIKILDFIKLEANLCKQKLKSARKL